VAFPVGIQEKAPRETQGVGHPEENQEGNQEVDLRGNREEDLPVEIQEENQEVDLRESPEEDHPAGSRQEGILVEHRQEHLEIPEEGRQEGSLVEALAAALQMEPGRRVLERGHRWQQEHQIRQGMLQPRSLGAERHHDQQHGLRQVHQTLARPYATARNQEEGVLRQRARQCSRRVKERDRERA